MSKACVVTNTAKVEFEHHDIYVVGELELEWLDDSFDHEFGRCTRGHYEVEMIRKVEYYDYESGKPVEPSYDVRLAIEERLWQYRFNADGDEL